MNIGSEAGDAHKGKVVDLKNALEVSVDGHEVGAETGVGCDGDAVLAGHSDHGVAVVGVDLGKGL